MVILKKGGLRLSVKETDAEMYLSAGWKLEKNEVEQKVEEPVKEEAIEKVKETKKPKQRNSKKTLNENNE